LRRKMTQKHKNYLKHRFGSPPTVIYNKHSATRCLVFSYRINIITSKTIRLDDIIKKLDIIYNTIA
jgi:hypothetical protein